MFAVIASRPPSDGKIILLCFFYIVYMCGLNHRLPHSITQTHGDSLLLSHVSMAQSEKDQIFFGQKDNNLHVVQPTICSMLDVYDSFSPASLIHVVCHPLYLLCWMFWVIGYTNQLRFLDPLSTLDVTHVRKDGYSCWHSSNVRVLGRMAPWNRVTWEWGCLGAGAPGNEGSTCNPS